MSGSISTTAIDNNVFEQAILIPQAEREAVWCKVWGQSAELQRDFLKPEHYVSHMERRVRGEVSVETFRRAKSSGRDPSDERFDEIALDVAKRDGWPESERRDMWSNIWHKLPARQRDFLRAEHYVSHMERKYKCTT